MARELEKRRTTEPQRRRETELERMPWPFSAAFAPLMNWWEPWWRTGSDYAMDVSEDDHNVYVEAEVPGFKKEEIQVSLRGDELRIVAEHRSNEEPQGTRWISERRQMRIERTLTLPSSVDPTQVDAHLENGVLRIEMKKSAEASRKSIQIR